MNIRRYRDSDWDDLVRMEFALLPHAAEEDDGQASWMRQIVSNPEAAVFVAERADGSVCGFVEAGTRPYADGCDTSPVGYVEAWWVDNDMRRHGIGRALLRAAEDWARGKGYQEMASDALLDNLVSHEAHKRNGYEEVDRVVQFRKSLDDDGKR
ncbi:MAG TPA: GNAT family N-acetyltransferase [Gemmatimonadaceae bacterium]|nr:GNAT family N-acetyltransferase [Gemmatimonadaceae bacterium]